MCQASAAEAEEEEEAGVVTIVRKQQSQSQSLSASQSRVRVCNARIMNPKLFALSSASRPSLLLPLSRSRDLASL